MTYGRNDTEKAVYTYGEERIAEDDLQTDETAEYLYDGRGSVVQTTIYTEVELSITYDPFGEITGGVDENFVGYAYNGEESSEVTGLQYLRARYYDTELGSFLTIDSYLGSLDDVLSQNRYTYANNDPVNNIDPSGHYSVNVNGANQYYQSTGLNEIRDYMTASALWAGEVSAQNGYNNAVARANNTNFQNYASISGISQSTADSYINKGIAQAGQVSMNYGCSVPSVPNEAVAEFVDNVNDARESANAKIESIKQNKKNQYDEYQEYIRQQLNALKDIFGFMNEWEDLLDIYSKYKVEINSLAADRIMENKDNIMNAATIFGVDPNIVAGVIFVEQYFNYDWVDVATDWIAFFGVIDMSVGIGQVRLSTAEFLEEKGYITPTEAEEGGWDLPFIGFIHGTETMAREKRLEDDETNILYVAAYLKYFQDQWCEAFPEISERPDILGSLYNIGHEREPHSNPKSTTFGDNVEKYYDLMDYLLGE